MTTIIIFALVILGMLLLLATLITGSILSIIASYKLLLSGSIILGILKGIIGMYGLVVSVLWSKRIIRAYDIVRVEHTIHTQRKRAGL